MVIDEIFDGWRRKVEHDYDRRRLAGGERRFRFDAQGKVFRSRGGGEIEVARWWYDFPDDAFEDESAVGGGEIRWNDSNETVVLRLTPRKHDELLINPQGKARRLVRDGNERPK